MLLAMSIVRYGVRTTSAHHDVNEDVTFVMDWMHEKDIKIVILINKSSQCWE